MTADILKNHNVFHILVLADYIYFHQGKLVLWCNNRTARYSEAAI